MTDKDLELKLNSFLERVKEITADGEAHFGPVLNIYLDIMAEFYPEYNAVIINSKHANEACSTLGWPFVKDIARPAYIGDYKNIKTYITPNVEADNIYFCMRSVFSSIDIYKPYMPVLQEKIDDVLRFNNWLKGE